MSINTQKPILEVAHLTKYFTRKSNGDNKTTTFTAVNDISFSLNRGECLGIVGESGSGKTTLVKLITRLLPMDKTIMGKIFLDGEDITHKNNRQLKQIYQKMQMIFQQPQDSFDPRQTLGNSIIEPMLNYGISKTNALNRLAELLQLTGLSSELANRYPHQVSGGQCQRAAIARAIALNPQILICDESTSALDVTVQQQIIKLLQDLQKQLNLSLILISHDLALVQQMCDRVIVIYQGKIIEEESIEQIINNPQNLYTKKLIESAIF